MAETNYLKELQGLTHLMNFHKTDMNQSKAKRKKVNNIELVLMEISSLPCWFTFTKGWIFDGKFARLWDNGRIFKLKINFISGIFLLQITLTVDSKTPGAFFPLLETSKKKWFPQLEDFLTVPETFSAM